MQGCGVWAGAGGRAGVGAWGHGMLGAQGKPCDGGTVRGPGRGRHGGQQEG